jgi:virulence-associated protein VapD
MTTYKRYKAINFDLSTKALIEVFGESNCRQAYNFIRRFLENRGFLHRQWSGYVSENAMGALEVTDVVIDLFEEQEWLLDCANRFDVTDIGKEYDMLSTLRSMERERTIEDVVPVV